MFSNTLFRQKTLSLKTLRRISTRNILNANHSCKLLIVGGGSGGCAVAAKFSKNLKKNDLIVLEPSEDHYYQPLFTLVGGGIEKLEDARKNEKDVLPQNCTWIKDKAVEFDLKNSEVRTEKGDVIKYDYLLTAMGLELRYDKIPGLLEALEKPDGLVCSNFSPKYVNRTYTAIRKVKSGNAIFTFPNSPVKCPGAPQKICYIAEDYFGKHNLKGNVKIYYNTSLPVIFGVKKYADALWKVCKERDINVNLRTNLVEVNDEKCEAVFENLDKPGEKSVISYSLLHVTPPMATSEALSKNKELTNEAGFVNVKKETLQHVKYPNVFAIGDCGSTPNSKTAAAAAAQADIVYENLKSVMSGKTPTRIYNGYASCPIVTSYDKCILAEFDYDLQPLETFPFSQSKEMQSMFILKKNVMPHIYWYLMMNGRWNGPELFRKIMHLDFGKNENKKVT